MLKKQLLIITLGLYSILPLFGQGEHFLHCLKVINNQEIELNWDISGYAEQFISYDIYHATVPSASFNMVGSISDHGQTTFTHQGVDPVLNQNYYFIIANFTSSTLISDTLSSIRLRVIPTDDKDIARLNWNAMHSPKLPGASGYQYIYRKYSFGNWELMDSTTVFVYYDTIRVCFDSINYRIITTGASGCESVSNVSGAWLNDLTQPPLPVLDSVSLDLEGNALLGWEASKDKGTVSYIIYRKQGNQTDSIDIVYGREITFYTDSTAEGCFHAQAYSIAAKDSCGNKSPYGINPQQESESMRNIHLQEIQYQACENRNILQWTAYINMKGGLDGYEIYAKEGNGSFTLLDFLAPGLLEYEHAGLIKNTEYAYFIRAVNTGRTISSTSCIKTVLTPYPEPAGFIYLQNVSVTDNEYIELKLFVDTSTASYGYQIERSADGLSFNTIDTVFPGSDDNLVYRDLTADVMNTSYQYRLHVLDSCGRESIVSNTSNNILLEVERLANERFMLHWNPFNGWQAPVMKYDIYRILDGGQVEFVESTGPNETELEVQVSSLDYAFFIEAIEDAGDPYGFRDSSRSNHALLNRKPEIFLPNAFRPGGKPGNSNPSSNSWKKVNTACSSSTAGGSSFLKAGIH
ncbi:MAG: hypothetical protein U5Q03_08990 [Bacteroidota bacterium]|nr:hypothetical protein [Bacteroidota bacterium]